MWPGLLRRYWSTVIAIKLQPDATPTPNCFAAAPPPKKYSSQASRDKLRAKDETKRRRTCPTTIGRRFPLSSLGIVRLRPAVRTG